MANKTNRTARNTRNTRTATTTAAVVPTLAPTMTLADVFAFARTVTADTLRATLDDVRRIMGANIPHERRNVGRSTNRRVMDFQHHAFDVNADPANHIDDVGMAVVWVTEFPRASGRVFQSPEPADIIGIIRSVRAQYNGGKHGAPAPSVASVAYGANASIRANAIVPRRVAPAVPAAVVNTVNVPAAAHDPKPVRRRRAS